ncbi:MAG: hypothetical protein LBI64_01590 [Coriobacteriales bacterium]|jgi:hypothetical protein|nr:hypothetical protein [Coriobacteriales bacterium]
MTLRTTHKLKLALSDKLASEAPELVAVAQRNIPKMRARVSGEIQQRYLDIWEQALGNTSELQALILDESDEGLSVWQLAPFAGAFTPQERYYILRRK